MTDIDFMFLAFSPCYSSNDFLIDVYCALHHVKSIKNSFNLPGSCTWGFSGGSVVKSLSMQETWVQSLGPKTFWRKKWQPTPVLLPGKSHGQGSLVGYSHGVTKESDMTY